MKRTSVRLVLLMALLLGAVACGGGRPSLAALAGSERIAAVPNGYQWTSFGQTDIADPASVPAAGLTPHVVAPGSIVLLVFSAPPDSVVMAAWRDGRSVPSPALAGLTFRVPSARGTYAFQVHASYGEDYADFDFALAVRSGTGSP